MKFAEYNAPCGNLLVGIHGEGICLCDWMIGDRIEKTLHRLGRFLNSSTGKDSEILPDRAVSQLDEYFEGKRKQFDIPLYLYGTEFQCRVWNALRHIPYGMTVSYKNVAETMSLVSGVRAVASAIGANPLSILIPCHRIIGSDGSLTGYAGGLEAKKYLLQLEKL